MNFVAKLPRYKIALMVILGYLVLVLHPLLGHTDLFAGVSRHNALTNHTQAVVATASSKAADCSLCQMAGSMTPGTAIARPVTAFLSFSQSVFIFLPSPTASIIPGLGFPRAPPTIG
jgi:hypothetical protein